MTVSSTPSLALHYAGLAINPANATAPTNPLVFPRAKTFDPGIEIKTDDDTGHTGTNTTLMDKDRTQASTSPNIEDKIRFTEVFEDILYLFCGSMDTVTAAITGATTAKKWHIFQDVVTSPDLPDATIVQGYNWKTAKAEVYPNCVANEINFTFDAGASPSFKADFLADMCLYNQTEPTRTFPSTEYRFKSGQTTIYIGNVGDTLVQLKADANKLDCYTKASLDLKNNLEQDVCGGTVYGTTKKNRKPFTGNGSITMDYNENNMNLEAEWATGSASGTNVSPDSVFKQILIESTGKLIETVTGTPNTPVYMNMQTLMPKVTLTKVSSPRSGDAKKDITVEFDIVSNASTVTSPIDFTLISPLAALHQGT